MIYDEWWMMNDEWWMNNKVPLTDDEEENEVKNTIQQTVSHFTSNTNKVILSIFSTKSILSYQIFALSKNINIKTFSFHHFFPIFNWKNEIYRMKQCLFFLITIICFFRVTVGFV